MARALQEEEERVRLGGRSKIMQLANVQSESRYKDTGIFFITLVHGYLKISVVLLNRLPFPIQHVASQLHKVRVNCVTGVVLHGNNLSVQCLLH